MISTRLFTGWLADHLTHVNLAQLGFLAQLIGEYLDDLVHHLGSARHCLRAACDKLVEVRNSPGKELLQKVEDMLITIIKVSSDQASKKRQKKVDNAAKKKKVFIRRQPGRLVEPLDMEAALSASLYHSLDILTSMGEPKASQ